MRKDSERFEDGIDTTSPYYRYVIKPAKETINAADEKLKELFKDLREGYNKTSANASQYVDDSMKKLKEYLEAKETPPPKKNEKIQYDIQNPDARESFVDPANPTVKYIPFVEKTSHIKEKDHLQNSVGDRYEKEPFGLKRKMLIEPDKIIPPNELVDLPEEEVIKRVNDLELPDENIKKQLTNQFLKRRSQMRKLKGMQMQDRGFLRFLVDEMKKKEQ
jgi:hypothetical protein